MKQINVKPRIVHPFFFCLVPVISLYAANIYEIYLRQIIIPLVIIVGLTWLMYRILHRLTGHDLKAALLTSAALLCFFSYGFVYRLYLQIGSFEFSRHRYLLPLIAFLYGAFAYAVLKIRSDCSRVTQVLNVFSVSLCLVMIVSLWMRSREIDKLLPHLFAIAQPQTSRALPQGYAPDIYYIILDGYARQDSLKRICNFDNQEFLGFLTRQGFYLATSSIANYSFTDLSLNASLNMMYLDEFKDSLGSDSRDKHALYALMRNNGVVRFLKSRGYAFVHFGSTMGGTTYNHLADANIGLPVSLEFVRVLARSTMLLCCSESLMDTLERAAMRHSLARLLEYACLPHKPTFYFAHYMITHPPFLFQSDGSAAQAAFERNDSGNRWKNPQLYVEQIRFMNANLEQLINRILVCSSRPPVIILQSDHGSAITWDSESLTDAHRTPEKIAERMSIMNAYYLPQGGAARLYPSISPVNSFRLIFDYYFGTRYGLMPDKHYFSDLDHFFVFSPVEFAHESR